MFFISLDSDLWVLIHLFNFIFLNFIWLHINIYIVLGTHILLNQGKLCIHMLRFLIVILIGLQWLFHLLSSSISFCFLKNVSFLLEYIWIFSSFNPSMSHWCWHNLINPSYRDQLQLLFALLFYHLKCLLLLSFFRYFLLNYYCNTDTICF